MISSDTLDVVEIPVVGDLARVWSELVGAGITAVPTSVRRSLAMHDGHTYVTQLRVGPDYRVSRIEHWFRAETAADTAIQRINALLSARIGWK